MPSVRRCIQASKENTGEALWKMKAAKEAGEEYYDPTREDNIRREKRDKISTLGRAPQRPNCRVGHSTDMGGKFVFKGLGPSDW